MEVGESMFDKSPFTYHHVRVKIYFYCETVQIPFKYFVDNERLQIYFTT